MLHIMYQINKNKRVSSVELYKRTVRKIYYSGVQWRSEKLSNYALPNYL
jgi:hypothetical protein